MYMSALIYSKHPNSSKWILENEFYFDKFIYHENTISLMCSFPSL